MRMHYLAIGLLAATVAASSLAQGAPAPASLPPATDTVAPEIAGVVKGGTKVQVIKTGLTTGTEGPIALNDGSGAVLFTEQQADRVSKIDKDGNVTPFLENVTGITAITINSNDIADNLKRNGGFIPGVKPGVQTSEFIDTLMPPYVV